MYRVGPHIQFLAGVGFFSEAPVFTKSALPRKKFQMPGKHAKVKLLLLLLLL